MPFKMDGMSQNIDNISDENLWDAIYKGFDDDICKKCRYEIYNDILPK
jgi:hypothetical protein